jgi:hypothetical protein
MDTENIVSESATKMVGGELPINTRKREDKLKLTDASLKLLFI